MEKWYLTRLITLRSGVRFPLPQQKKIKSSGKRLTSKWQVIILCWFESNNFRLEIWRKWYTQLLDNSLLNILSFFFKHKDSSGLRVTSINLMLSKSLSMLTLCFIFASVAQRLVRQSSKLGMTVRFCSFALLFTFGCRNGRFPCDK